MPTPHRSTSPSAASIAPGIGTRPSRRGFLGAGATASLAAGLMCKIFDKPPLRADVMETGPNTFTYEVSTGKDK
jgi:hypothetical protein